ncbi:uncharacterized protein LOC123886954 [Trifolium pratense]|uniref:uncharacterized protein LOC123886954 n=1 Tax=Trifolium pratense TaxID=57577 RepID=UPI001E692EC7|nr:uncharacterized protein LOC123886954 [Trifolium pratense]
MVEAKSSNPKSSNPINQSNGEKRMEDKVIMIEKPNTSHPIKPKSDKDRIGEVGLLSMVLCVTVIMFPTVKATSVVDEEHYPGLTVLLFVYVLFFQLAIGGSTLNHPVNNSIFYVLYMLLFTSVVSVIASGLVSKTAAIIILILWVHMIGFTVDHNWQVISSVDEEDSKRFWKFIAFICVISLLCSINSTVIFKVCYKLVVGT